MTLPNPCPFCASTSVAVQYVTGHYRAVVCADCHAVGPVVRHSADAAARLWNLRVREAVPSYIDNDITTVKMVKHVI